MLTTVASQKIRIAVALALLVFVGCATASVQPPAVVLKMESNVPDATVLIDDHLVGRLSDFTKSRKRLPVGFHRVEVRAPGYYSFFQEIDAKPGSDIAIRADLHELLQ